MSKKIALAGNPNVGKSTIFNALTGKQQHTGNWTGKTVEKCEGSYFYEHKKYDLVDLPGTYSLFAHSLEEEITRDSICWDAYDCVVVVCDATALRKSLNLVLQTLEMTQKVVVCVNLMDEAKKRSISIDKDRLSHHLQVPVVFTSSNDKASLQQLCKAIAEVEESNVSVGFSIHYPCLIEVIIDELAKKIENQRKDRKWNLNSRWLALRMLEKEHSPSLENYFDQIMNQEMEKWIENKRKLLYQSPYHMRFQDVLIESIMKQVENIVLECVSYDITVVRERERKIDRILVHPIYGKLIMTLLLGCLLWITIVAANYPSQILFSFFAFGEEKLRNIFVLMIFPDWLVSLLMDGIYRVLTWVVSVMLPPMAIFFPLFTFLEDLGYLPRVAFLLDHSFQKACTCGKQALTMCMGFGCNAAGVVGCRIIDSPRERLIAIITNAFVPCNGRFPSLIFFLSFLFSFFFDSISSFVEALFLFFLLSLGVAMTLLFSWLLSKTVLKGTPSSFVLELPPYRRVQLKKIIVRSFLDKTLHVLWRALIASTFAGVILWLFANLQYHDQSLLQYLATLLDPIGLLFGLDGAILLAFLLGFPANEIVLPILLMIYLSGTKLIEFDNSTISFLLLQQGWNYQKVISMLVFLLFHWPCATTCMTIYKEGREMRWVVLSMFLPTVCGGLLLIALRIVFRIG